jgi:hypothetical protein
VHAAFRRRGVLFLTFLTLTLAALALYVPRSYRALAVVGDSAELVTAAATWGVPHAPGYPLYTLVAHLATLVPAFEVPFRVHVTSAIFHAATVGVVGCLVALLTESLAAVGIAAATLALGRTFFAGSLYAEVFPLNDLFFACLLFFGAVIARDERARAEAESPPHARSTRVPALASAVTLGLAFAHQPMIALAAPALAILVGPALLRYADERPRAAGALVLGTLALGALPYTLIPFAASRGRFPSWGEVRDLRELVHLATRQDYGGVLRASRNAVQGQLGERLDVFLLGTGQSFGAIATLLALLGIRSGWRRDRATSIALVVAFLCTGPLFVAMNAFDIHSDDRVLSFERFTTMSHIPVAVLVGLGTAWAEQWLGDPELIPRLPPQRAAAFSRAAFGFVAVVATAPLLDPLADLDFSENTRGAVYAHDVVDSAADGALVLLKSDMASQAALFACAVEHRCGDRIVITPGQLSMPWKKRELQRRYPALPLPPDDIGAPARWLVEHNQATRAVFVHPDLLDEVVRGDLASLPSGLLFRVYPDQRSLYADLPAFRGASAAITTRQRCEGCVLVRGERPSLAADAQLARIYDAAVRAHEDAARALGLSWDAETLAAWRKAR